MIDNNVKSQDDAGFIENTRALEIVREEMAKALNASPLIVRKYMSHLGASNGKCIRAEALMACAENDEGMLHPNVVKIAAAVELLHLATLVHDDVMDNASTRRGTETLQKKYGQRTAVICGDYLFCVALKLASSISDREKYLDLYVPDYMGRVCLGELKQHVNNGFLDLSVYSYLKIIAGKTAALFEASFYAGAVLCGNDGPTVVKYKKLGKYVGMIFQMTDDCLDFETTQNLAGKPVQSDFEQGVVTLPLIYAFKKITGLKDKAKGGDLTGKDVKEAVNKAGGLDFTRGLSGKYYDKAIKIINGLEITQDKRIKLKSILDKAYRSA